MNYTTPKNTRPINLLAPKGDKEKPTMRRMLKLRDGAFGTEKSEGFHGLLQSAARPKHGNATHGTPKAVAS